MQRVVIIYDNRGGPNSEQLAAYAEVLQKKYESLGDYVQMCPVSSAENIASQWNSLGSGYCDHVDILCHGGPGSLSCNNQEVKFDGLDNININNSISLYSCNGGTNINGTSVAQILADKSNAPVKAVVNARCWIDGKHCYGPYSVSFVSWSFFKKSVKDCFVGRWGLFLPQKVKTALKTRLLSRGTRRSIGRRRPRRR